MYYYIVDPQKISQREFERVQNILYSSLSEYRISGEVVRVTGLRTISQLVETAFSRDVKTLVAVGTEDTLQEVVNAIKGREVVVGFIPLVEEEIGRILGVSGIEQGVKTIAARRIQQMDLGLINQQYFISKLTFGSLPQSQGLFAALTGAQTSSPTMDLKLSADDQYQATFQTTFGIINNGRIRGQIDVVLAPKLGGWSAFRYRKDILAGNFENLPHAASLHVKKIEITAPEGMPLRSGTKVIARTPAIIEVSAKAIKIIVGKDRNF